ncbi:Z1 domain-containing protein [Rathayibacter sp. VKM Ac-2857]|uniref:Z1 domain-containing protein n=1 Tax=Rathayibacter sp. VKM Ac-2857 TaxID=2739020 RepID=UPI001564EA72|nr:Z1 domain-containing protein [Rathayibacter sp. VKM Ac-2857]NQX16436.1 hypothetical protein [Rathayibacter sp. VKM Ac-2857]
MSGFDAEQIYLDGPPPDQESWWGRYASTLSGLTSTGLNALRADSEHILRRGIFGAGKPTDNRWKTKIRTGLVMGSVQSGKTASMFGVSALALDEEIDIVVILAGTRLSLWRQTYERMAAQLDSGEDGVEKANRRLLIPNPGVALSRSSSSLSDVYRMQTAQFRRKLSDKAPLIIVAMKQTDHLYALGSSLRKSVFPAILSEDRPVHMLVLDDEADDGSVLDAAVEAGHDSLWSGYKQIPRAIADLWEPRSTGSPPNLYTTYIGYTATPQANLLQEEHNPLAPRDFVIALRTPADRGHPVDLTSTDAPRSSSYPEPTGLSNYYTGGDVFYRRGASAELCVDLTGEEDQDLGRALRAFLVAGAVLRARNPNGDRLTEIQSTRFSSEWDASVASPEPHSMLIHPASEINKHFETAEDILLWAGIPSRATAAAIVESGEGYLPPSLLDRIENEEPLWEEWAIRYQQSSSLIEDEFDLMTSRPVPEWSVLKDILTTEIIPGTRVSVVNSDPNADDRPSYKPRYDQEERVWRAARDLSTIFVSGNVMARGLTLEGLTTALFQRDTLTPLADTQMQMQRWFGYRGKYLELCRVFATEQQFNLFRSYDDIDEAIRIAILSAANSDDVTPDVLHGMQFLATGKISNLSRTPLCPGPRPFITTVNSGEMEDPNARYVADLFRMIPSAEVTAGGVVRGRALDQQLSMTEAADLLDNLTYTGYYPGEKSDLAQLWSKIESRVSAVRPLAAGGLYRAPGPTDGGRASAPMLNCPYSIAAYLRLWDACLTRSVQGLFVTGSPSDLWSMVNLTEKQSQQPTFTVGIRYGMGASLENEVFGLLGAKATTKRIGSDGTMETRWGANNPAADSTQYRGDEFFDYYHRGDRIALSSNGSSWRPSGEPGQILFYVNQLAEGEQPVVAVGVCIPSGGPEQFSATRVTG